MECPKCGAWMRRYTDKINGKVFWECPLCPYCEETKELAPSPDEDWGENNED